MVVRRRSGAGSDLFGRVPGFPTGDVRQSCGSSSFGASRPVAVAFVRRVLGYRCSRCCPPFHRGPRGCFTVVTRLALRLVEWAHLRCGGVLVTVSMRVMSAGDGYAYLLRSVVTGDGRASQTSALTRYYTEAGTP